MQHLRILMLFWLFCGYVASSSAFTGVETTDPLKEALANLSASNAAWQRNDAEFRALRRQDGISATEIEEFAGFVAGQRRQMFEDCQAVRDLGADPSQSGFDCQLAERQAAARRELPAANAAVLTEREKDAALDEELRKLEADLDNLVLGQQENLRNTARRRSVASTGSGTGLGQPAASGAESGASGARPQQGGERGRNTVNEQGAGPGAQKHARNQPEQEESPTIGDLGNDDDVVARQLREAAEAETDPVLKEKLWAEYRKYRASK